MPAASPRPPGPRRGCRRSPLAGDGVPDEELQLLRTPGLANRGLLARWRPPSMAATYGGPGTGTGLRSPRARPASRGCLHRTRPMIPQTQQRATTTLHVPSDPSRFVERVTPGAGATTAGAGGRDADATPRSLWIVRQGAAVSEVCSGTGRSRRAFISPSRARRAFSRSARFLRSAVRSSGSSASEAVYSRRADRQPSWRATARHSSQQYRWPRKWLTQTENHRSQFLQTHWMRMRSSARAR